MIEADAGSSAQLDVYMPEWFSDELFDSIGSGDGVTIHVTTGPEAPVPVQVPEGWSRQQIEITLARHVCARLDWLDFTWIDMDVSIEYSSAYPRCDGDEADSLRTVVADLPKGSMHKRALTQTSEVIVGHRACWKRGLTSFTTTNQEYVKGLVASIIALVPDAVFNAAALVTHGSTAAHRDVTNEPTKEMTLIPLDATPEAWIWYECATGSTQVLVDGSEIRGSWVPYSRVLCFNAMAAHMIQSPGSMNSVVLYRTARVAVRRLLVKLAELGFPLDIAELTTMATEPEGYTSDEIDQSGDDEEQIELPDEHTADHHLPEGEEIVLGIALDTQWTGGKRTVVYKAQRDGSFKRLHAEMLEGSTVLQLRQALKRHLKLNILKVFLTLWQDGEDMPDLDDDAVVSSECLYHVRVRSLPVGASITARQQHGGQSRAIGAPRGTRPLPNSTSGGELGGRPGPAVSASASGAPPDESVVRGQKRVCAPTPRLQTTRPRQDDDSLEARVSALEAKQAEILRILQSTQETMLHQLRGAQQTQQPIRPLQQRPERQARGAAKSSSSYGKSSWRQGGGRFHRVQQEAVSQSAASLVHTDLESRPCDISG
eukprot:6473421-Amphidinium_carterae.2